jgi:hypothetical protein
MPATLPLWMMSLDSGKLNYVYGEKLMPTSCILCELYVDDMVRYINATKLMENFNLFDISKFWFVISEIGPGGP